MIKFVILFWLSPPTHYQVFEYIKENSIICPEIVMAQAIVESGHFQSYNCIVRNNLFGLRNKKNICDSNPMGYYVFDKWEDSVLAYKNWIAKKHRIGEDYYSFLKRIGYAEEKSYINILKKINYGSK